MKKNITLGQVQVLFSSARRYNNHKKGLFEYDLILLEKNMKQTQFLVSLANSLFRYRGSVYEKHHAKKAL